MVQHYEQFPWLFPATFTPTVRSHFDWWIVRRTVWEVEKRDGTHGTFTSWWFINHLQYYQGDSKADGSESLGAGIPVMTDRPQELLAFRWRANGPSPVSWTDMGGS